MCYGVQPRFNETAEFVVHDRATAGIEFQVRGGIPGVPSVHSCVCVCVCVYIEER